MFKNYLITAYKVLLRRKFFTFIGLFGIALTLAILLVVSTVIDNYLYPTGPEKNNAHFVSINHLLLKSEDGGGMSSGDVGHYFLSTNVARLKVPQKMSFYTLADGVASYLNGDKLVNELRRTDAAYWDILDFEFIEGRHFDQSAFNAGAHQMVISQTTAGEFFGDSRALGKFIVVNEQQFEIIGVVKDVSRLESEAFADMWVPYTTLPSTAYKSRILGGWSALLYHSDATKRESMQKEYVHMLKHDFIANDPERYHTAIGGADTTLEKFSREYYQSGQYDSGASELVGIVLMLAIGFMLLPSINLINLNISRIMERTSEIGVRKAFGATRQQLVMQFIVENLMVTLVGAIVGFVLSWLMLIQIENSAVIPVSELSFSLNIFGYGLVMVLIFGLLSGSYPAYKMSKLHPVNALKGGV